MTHLLSYAHIAYATLSDTHIPRTDNATVCTAASVQIFHRITYTVKAPTISLLRQYLVNSTYAAFLTFLTHPT